MRSLNTKLLIAAGLTVMLSAATVQSAQAQARSKFHPGVAAHKQDNAAMRNAEHQLAEAEKVMKTALPIYEGHRHNAMAWDGIAVGEIKIGIKWNSTRNDPNALKMHSQTKSQMHVQAESPTRKYSAHEVAVSNAKLQKASTILVSARTTLVAAPHDYGGHRSLAVQSIEQSLKEIQIALSIGNQGSSASHSTKHGGKVIHP